MRTTFAGRGHRLEQLIHDRPLPLPVVEVDLSREDAPASALRQAVAAEVRARADTAVQPVRVTLWRLSPVEHLLCITMHHLVTDGWSTAVVAQELALLYERFVANGRQLPAVEWQYAEWAAWHQRQLEGERFRQLQAYWRPRLAGAKVPALPRRDSGVALHERRTTVERARLSEAVVTALQRFARARGVAFFTVLLSVFYVLLAREVGTRDLACGSVFANRTRREARSTVGFLSNMILLRATLGARPTFAQVVAATDATVIGAFSHQELPMQMLPLSTIDATSVRPEALVFQLFTGPLRRTTAGGVVFDPVVDVPDDMGSRWEFELSLAPAGAELAVLLSYARDSL